MTGRMGTRLTTMGEDRSLRDRMRLYVVTDEQDDAGSLLQALSGAMAGGAGTVQLRRKGELGRRFVELGRAVRSLTREAGALFIVNDRVDVALLVDADGVHLGQDDISCRDARRLLPDRLVGISAATAQEAVRAERDGADYLGVGAIFPTPSKADADICGLAGLREAARAVSIPVVAIGGIDARTAALAASAGAAGVAVVSAVMGAPDPRLAAHSLLSGMNGGGRE